MAKNRIPPLARTQDSFRLDKDFEANPKHELGNSRAGDIRRDLDKAKNVSITLYDIDAAMKAYIVDVMKPTVETSAGIIPVPVYFASGEKWVSIQEQGFMRDEKGKLLVPAIAIKRTSVVSSEIKFPKIATINNLNYTIQSNFTKANPYDQFSLLNNLKPRKEYFVTAIPEFIELQYDVSIWTDFQVQINKLVEQFIWFGGNFFGDKNLFKFYSDFDSTNIDISNTVGDDRVVKATFSMKTKAYILPLDAALEMQTQKTVSTSQVIFTNESSISEDGIIDDGSNGRSASANPKSPGVYPHDTDNSSQNNE